MPKGVGHLQTHVLTSVEVLESVFIAVKWEDFLKGPENKFRAVQSMSCSCVMRTEMCILVSSFLKICPVFAEESF